MSGPHGTGHLPHTVKVADLFGNVTDTYKTEGELNGYREEQARLVGLQGELAEDEPLDPAEIEDERRLMRWEASRDEW